MVAQTQTSRAPALTQQVVETLYSEALVVADEARMVFDISRSDGCDDVTKLARSVEGMKTTTRVMNMLAWLLNQRAYFAGELSEKQLRLYGELPENRETDHDNFAILDLDTQEIVTQSETLFARIARLDEQQRSEGIAERCEARALQDRVLQAFAA